MPRHLNNHYTCLLFPAACREVFSDGKNGARYTIERNEKDGRVHTGATGYMLFKKDCFPDTSAKTATGERIHKNGYRTEVSCGEYIRLPSLEAHIDCPSASIRFLMAPTTRLPLASNRCKTQRLTLPRCCRPKRF